MGSITSNRKRTEELSSVNRTYSSPCSSDSRASKRARFSSVPQTSIRQALSSNSTASRIVKYPESKARLLREVHAPTRTRKFDLASSNRGLRSRACVISEEKELGYLGNVLANYSRAKQNALETLRFINKGTEDTDSQKDAKSEDSSIEEVEVTEDGREGVSVVTDQGRQGSAVIVDEIQDLDAKVREGGLQQHSTSSVISDLNNGYLKVENAEKLWRSLSVEHDISSKHVYEKLLDAVNSSSRTDKLRRLNFEIELYEKQKSHLALLRDLKPKKEPVEDVPREPFVPLTKEEEAEVAKAFSASREVLIAHENSNIEITGQIFQCLRPGKWLNDEVINLYLELLKEREKREPRKFLKCHFFNTFFYKKLISGRRGYDFKSVRRWTSQRKLGYGLIECDKIFIPIHKEIHWCLAIINKKDKTFQYLDSLRGRDTQVLRVLAKYYVDEVKDKSGKDIDIRSWEQEFVDDLPEQENGFDCGMFMIKYTDFYSRGLGLCFNQEHMPYFRLRTAKEILRLKAD